MRRRGCGQEFPSEMGHREDQRVAPPHFYICNMNKNDKKENSNKSNK